MLERGIFQEANFNIGTMALQLSDTRFGYYTINMSHMHPQQVRKARAENIRNYACLDEVMANLRAFSNKTCNGFSLVKQKRGVTFCLGQILITKHIFSKSETAIQWISGEEECISFVWQFYMQWVWLWNPRSFSITEQVLQRILNHSVWLTVAGVSARANQMWISLFAHAKGQSPPNALSTQSWAEADKNSNF